LHVKLSKRKSALVATAIAGAMLMSACSGSDNSGNGGSSASTGGTFSVYIGEPENPLIPGNTTESEGDQVVNSLWTGLIQYAKDGSVQYTGVADSIKSDDNIAWTITLKDGWTFHDGTPVTAKSFVDAWNYTAYSPNAQQTSSFFDKIEGFSALQAPTDADGNVTGEPTAKELTGLKVVDDTTFTVKLAAPFAQLPVILGYNPFFPLPESFFADPAAFGKKPVGNGPFKADAEFVPGTGITLTRYDKYAGEDAAHADSVEYRVYAEQNTAYTDAQAGTLDVVDVIPPDAITSAKDEFGDRYLENPSAQITFMGMPTYDPRYADPRVRRAISMAVDRKAIADAIFNGTRAPADSFIAPVVDGYRKGVCDECKLDAKAANALLDEAGFDRSKPIELWFNSGAGHDAWMQAVGNQLKQNLGVDYVLKGELEFAQYLPLLEGKGATGPFRYGWAMDYPSPQSYLEPLYTTGGSANYDYYSNPKFEALVEEGNSASNNDDAVKAYQGAEDILLQDMPMIPMFFGLYQSVHSDKVDNVAIDIFGRVKVADVTVK
jgi:ABC-type transport system substrate-binding protein